MSESLCAICGELRVIAHDGRQWLCADCHLGGRTTPSRVTTPLALLLAEVVALRNSSGRLGAHAQVTFRGCSETLLVEAEKYGSRRLGRSEIEEWDYVVVCHGMVVFAGEHRPAVRERNPRGTGAEDEHARSTVNMARIDGGG